MHAWVEENRIDHQLVPLDSGNGCCLGVGRPEHRRRGSQRCRGQRRRDWHRLCLSLEGERSRAVGVRDEDW
jgi:hypothetical protein